VPGLRWLGVRSSWLADVDAGALHRLTARDQSLIPGLHASLRAAEGAGLSRGAPAAFSGTDDGGGLLALSPLAASAADGHLVAGLHSSLKVEKQQDRYAAEGEMQRWRDELETMQVRLGCLFAVVGGGVTELDQLGGVNRQQP
jgi:hypothetical protein